MSQDSHFHIQDDWKAIVQKSLENLQFGSVEITVHNGGVVQIERMERTRIESGRFHKRGESRTANGH